MKFKIDENLPIEIAQLLQESGYDAATVLEQQLGGKPDDNIAQICQQEDRIIVTLDLDFADIRTYPPLEYAGMIVFRLSRQDKFHVLNVCQRLLAVFERETPQQKLWIVEDNRIRIRS
jgi:predicted nuclease of predicted toxin-antitoxin system